MAVFAWAILQTLEGVMSIESHPGPNGDPGLHNPVLTRTHEPPRAGNHSWIMLGALAVAIVAGAAFWWYNQAHPAGPLVNHAVEQSSGPAYATR